jgi:hypothetical protein
MTRRQKTLIAGLAIANIIVIVSLVVLIIRSPATDPSPLRSPLISTATPPPPSDRATGTLQERALTKEPPTPEACQWETTQHLARAGLSGSVSLAPDGALFVEIVHSLAPGQTTDDAAQLVWTVFDIVLSLDEQGKCGPFTHVEVAILARGDQVDATVNASVSAADLEAYGAGELSENEFIERVSYTIVDR